MVVFSIQQLHLRRVGVEAQPDVISSVPKDGSGGSSNEPNNGREDADDSSESDKRDSEAPSTAESADPPLAPEATGSHDLDNQLLKMAKLSQGSDESTTPPLPDAFFRDKQKLLVSGALLNIAREFLILNLLPLYLGHCTLTGNVAAM